MDDFLPLIQKQKILLAKVQASLNNIAALQEDPAKRVITLRKELPSLEKSIKDLRLDPVILQVIQDKLNNAWNELAEKESLLKDKFGSDLAVALKPHNFNLEGHLPKLRTSVYTIEVDYPADKVTIWFGRESEKLDTTKAIPEIVVESLIKQHRLITCRHDFNEKTFLRTLKTAYQMYLIRSMRPAGSDAPLPEIHTLCSLLMQNDKFRRNPVKENLTEYTRAMFSYDLSRLKTRSIDQSELKLYTAVMSETAIKGNCFWIPPFEGTPDGTYSRLKFIGVS